MNRLAILASGCLLINGCSNLQTVHVETEMVDTRIKEINETAAGRAVKIGFHDCGVLYGRNLIVASDSLHFDTYTGSGEVSRAASMESVETILVFLHGPSDAEAGALGVGTWSGMILASVYGAVRGISGTSVNLLDLAFISGGSLAFGAMIGILFNLGDDQVDVLYVFDTNSEQTQKDPDVCITACIDVAGRLDSSQCTHHGDTSTCKRSGLASTASNLCSQ